MRVAVLLPFFASASGGVRFFLFGPRAIGQRDGVRPLVESFDIVKFCIFQRNLLNFRGLVLFSIEAGFCNQILFFKAFFEVYKIFTPSHRSKFKSSQNFVKLFRIFCSNFCKNPYFSAIFIEFRIDVDENFSRFRRIL